MQDTEKEKIKQEKKTGRRKRERWIIRKGEERRQKTRKRENKLRVTLFCIKNCNRAVNIN